MKKPAETTIYYFVDEAGDPAFFGRRNRVVLGTEGCSPILAVGFVECHAPRPIRAALGELRERIVRDPYLAAVPSMRKTRESFHAKDDCPEVRMLVFRMLASLDFKAQVVVGRKILRMFETRFQRSRSAFYDDLVGKLFENVLHRHVRSCICFSARSSKAGQAPYLSAIRNGVARFERKWGTTVDTQVDVIVQRPREEPCLQVVDYALWAVYRAYTKREMRFFDSIRDKFSLVNDPYDARSYPNVYYDRDSNPFHINKTSPL